MGQTNQNNKNKDVDSLIKSAEGLLNYDDDDSADNDDTDEEGKQKFI